MRGPEFEGHLKDYHNHSYESLKLMRDKNKDGQMLLAELIKDHAYDHAKLPGFMAIYHEHENLGRTVEVVVEEPGPITKEDV